MLKKTALKTMLISVLVMYQLIFTNVQCYESRYVKLDQFLARIQGFRDVDESVEFENKSDLKTGTVPIEKNWQSDQNRKIFKRPIQNQTSEENLRRKSAMNLTLKVFREGECRVPQKRIIPVRQMYRSTDRNYSPKCMTLFRCSEDTGCCYSASLVCAPKEQEMIKQHFFVTVMSTNIEVRTEELTFYNHTSCECIEKDKLMADSPPDLVTTNKPLMTLKSCICPKKFKSIYKPNGQCYCGCAKANRACKSMIRGEEHLSLLDRYCISQGKCREPMCKYGLYKSNIGRCPNETEKHNNSDLFKLRIN